MTKEKAAIYLTTVNIVTHENTNSHVLVKVRLATNPTAAEVLAFREFMASAYKLVHAAQNSGHWRGAERH